MDRVDLVLAVVDGLPGQADAQIDAGRPGPGPALGPAREPDPPTNPVVHVFNSVFT